MALIDPNLLDWWFNHNYNVLFVGKHGVGKTSLIKSCFERHNLEINKTFLYFSASTLDPWVDLIGIPKEIKDQNNNIYLDLVRPKSLYEGQVEAIFFDEYNRSPKKVRNAIMELIQFKSINGLKFPKLKVIWAAINPDDTETYDVEPIDPAQQDRFHIIKTIPYDCDEEYFLNKYGDDLALPAINWWRDLPEDQKNLVSPRRLQYVIETYSHSGDISEVIPASTNIKKLLDSLKCGSLEKKLKSLYDKDDKAEIKLFFANDNNINNSLKYIIADAKYMEKFVHLFPKEVIVQLLSKDALILKFVVNKENINKYDTFKNITRSILASKSNNSLRNLIIKEFAKTDNKKIFFFEPALKRPKGGFSEVLGHIHNTMMYDQDDKIRKYTYLVNNIIEDLTIDEAISILIFISRVLCGNGTKIKESDFLWYPNIISLINFLILIVENATTRSQDTSIIESISRKNAELDDLFKNLHSSKVWEEIYQGAA